jgi:hypothetical protein
MDLGENAMPCTSLGQGGSLVGRLTQAHIATVANAQTAATTKAEIHFFIRPKFNRAVVGLALNFAP